ncbi:hypothetical protein MIMGU_mgv1a017719mg [Erythranthe guttata]|uniref:NAC-A/B domain-containing protein n=2 Tax=Erythranthe guttata TaxID=4155 RepID=A0A022R538_ERYGU|nr:hypothetical protein MIMGU_mgv1a017719mg [Erythranthe guttata]
MESMRDGQPSLEDMIRVAQLRDLLSLERAMQNLDKKPMPCVSQVTIKKIKDTKVVISNPTVFKVPNSDTYIILGNDAQTGNLSSLLQQPSESESDESESDEDSGSEEEDDVANSESDEVDESGSSDDVDESESEEDGENLSWSEQEDIKLVANHTGVSKRKAAKALKEFDGDIVAAIMELNSN